MRIELTEAHRVKGKEREAGEMVIVRREDGERLVKQGIATEVEERVVAQPENRVVEQPENRAAQRFRSFEQFGR